ncbi:FxsA family protein [Roseovarius sp. D22-M7]|uniref:FxsA family protein n=1 Tax=Roseovarius sp. D22-M7 TaxID=3127116 RepID=UPI0030105191
MWLLIAFIAVPLIEIALFIEVGGAIGLWPTLALVVLTAIIGTWLLRMQGRLALAEVKRSFSDVDDPSEPLAHGAMILFAGALLLTPGFFTDVVGFALLSPPVRRRIFAEIRKRVRLATFEAGPNRPPHGSAQDGPDIIDAEFEDLDQPRHGPNGGTPRGRH